MTITDAAVADEFTHLFCSPDALNPVCAECETAGRRRDHVERKVTDLPIVGHPTRLHVRVPRFVCENTGCDTRIFQQRLPLLAEDRAKALGLGWDLVNELALSKIRTMVYDQPGHFDGVRVLDVDEHSGSTSAATVPLRSSPCSSTSHLSWTAPARPGCWT